KGEWFDRQKAEMPREPAGKTATESLRRSLGHEQGRMWIRRARASPERRSRHRRAWRNVDPFVCDRATALSLDFPGAVGRLCCIPPVASVAGCEARFGGPQRFKRWRLPRWRLADLAVGVFQGPRELAGGDWSVAQLLEECGLQIETASLEGMRVEHTDAEAQLGLGDLDRCLQVGVVGDDDR